jgi:tripartite-type tricarboxylate transporter receptor subunit TctC
MNGRPNRRVFCAAVGATAVSTVLQKNAAAQAWPQRPLRLIVPFPAGGGTDAISRHLAERISQNAGFTIVVENRAGAGGNIGLDAVAKAPPDGYTIGMGQTSNLAINPALYPKMPYDPLRDFVPISSVASQPLVVVVSGKSEVKTLADLVALAKQKPNAVSLAHAGNGTVGHLGGEMFARRAGIKLLIVPYKGIAPAITDVLGGQVDTLFGNPLAVMSLVGAGNLRALAVTGPRRMQALPDVPTVAESGYAGFEAVNWSGLVAPASTPEAIVVRLNAETAAALRRPDMLEKLATDGSEPFACTPAEFAAFVRDEHAKWGVIVRDAGIKLD